MSDTQRQQFENARQVDFSYSVPRTARMRVNAYLQRGAVSAALRVIPSEIQSLEALGHAAVGSRRWPACPAAWCWSPGRRAPASPPRSRVIDQINSTREEHILTIEDPIEFLHQPQALPGQPARGGQRRARASPTACAPRCARTPT